MWFGFQGDARHPGTIEQLKEAIRQEVAAIPPAMTRKAMDNFCELLQEFVINNGRHLSDVIFKSVWKKIASYVLFINKKNFVYLVSFDFYRPSKCGSYFCRTLYVRLFPPPSNASTYALFRHIACLRAYIGMWGHLMMMKMMMMMMMMMHYSNYVTSKRSTWFLRRGRARERKHLFSSTLPSCCKLS